jgi:hypothetical protein
LESKYDSFDNLETSIRKSSVIQERINLVSTHMYKQFLEYQHSGINMQEIFIKIADNLQATIDYLKQSFGARGVSTENIFYELDSSKTILVVNILWHTISFTTRWNAQPQALYRGIEPPLISGRIIAVKGNIQDIIKKNGGNELQTVLEQEIASLFIPADKTQSGIIKINHLGNKEFYLSQMDAPREFLLKVIETICGGGIYHEEISTKPKI